MVYLYYKLYSNKTLPHHTTMSLFDLIKNNKIDDVIDILLFGDTSSKDLIRVIRMTEDSDIIFMAANDIKYIKKMPSDVLNKIYLSQDQN